MIRNTEIDSYVPLDSNKQSESGRSNLVTFYFTLFAVFQTLYPCRIAVEDGPSSPAGQRTGSYTRGNLAVVRLKKDLHELAVARTLAPGAMTSVEFPDGHKNLLLMRTNIRISSGIFRGGSFWFQIDVPPQYPFHAPRITCLTRTWHPAIDPASGAVSLPILSPDEWRPVLTVNAVLFGLQLLFVEPNPEAPSPANLIAAETLAMSPVEFEHQVRQTLDGGTFFGLKFEPNYSYAETPPPGNTVRRGPGLFLNYYNIKPFQ